MKFTDSQLKAIHHSDGNLQLIACAGSGKTEVVSRHVAELLRPPTSGTGLIPANIVAFTYTEKAAAELKDRIATRCREAHGEIRGMAEMYVGTIHGFCLHLLQDEAPKFLKYDVLNEIQQLLFVDRSSKKSGLTESADLNGKPLTRYMDTKLYITALSLLREAELNESALRGNTVVTGLRNYQTLMDEKGYLDYSSILVEAANILMSDVDLQARLKARVKHVIVDEYQDVNPIQEGIVRQFQTLGARVVVVGDDDQTIYQWRGSDINNILTFADRYPKVSKVALEDNYRSSSGIVETARTFIEQNNERLRKR